MCEVCVKEGENYLFKNGSKNKLTTSNLYKVYKDAIAPIKLCHVHAIELFHVGERRFLREHLDFARALATKGHHNSSEESHFGL